MATIKRSPDRSGRDDAKDLPSASHSEVFHATGDKKPAIVACETFLARFRAEAASFGLF
jgi:hypothetical protein